MVALGGPVRSAALIASLALAGCFYIDPINQRPSLGIDQEVVGTIYRGQSVSFLAKVEDPDDHDVDLAWGAYMCTDATTSASCDATAGVTGIGPRFEFLVPGLRADGATPVQGMRIVLNGIDDHGAAAKPSQILELEVKDRSPTLEPLRDTSPYVQPGPMYVVDLPIELYASYTDGDDSLDELTVEWKVYAPAQVPIDLVDTPVGQPNPSHRQVGKILRPQITGTWKVEVTVTDPVGNQAMQMVTLIVVADRLPCIAAVAPALPPVGSVLPVYDPTVFQVPSVDDDLDSYPGFDTGEFGEATFTWSILEPNSARRVIGTGENVLFDPDLYAPGTPIEIRVEVQDRTQTPVSCADDMPTCGTMSCVQRQTWRVEAR